MSSHEPDDDLPQPVAGAAGAGDDEGEETIGDNEGVLEPACASLAAVTVRAGVGLGLSITSDQRGVALYGWDPFSNAALIRWSDSLSPADWSAWRCFDTVPRLTHVTALNGYAGQAEVFVAVSGSNLLARRQAATGWTPWLPLSLPIKAAVDGLSSVGGSRSRIYVAMDGRIYYRAKTEEDPRAAYGPWHALAANDATVVASAQSSEGAQVVIGIDRAGNVALSEQRTENEPFGAWTRLATIGTAVSDALVLDVPGQGPTFYALGADGSLWSLARRDALGWASVAPDVLGATVTAIAGRMNGEFPQLYGIDATGGTYRLLVGRWLATSSTEGKP